jgi:hypothetical protein
VPAILLTSGCFLSAALPARAADPDQVASLAKAVPANARLFMEVREVEEMLLTPVGATTSALLANWMFRAEEAESSEAPDDGAVSPRVNFLNWRQQLVRTMGIKDPQAVRLLFNGPVGFAADSWSALGTATLLAEPRRTDKLENMLADRLIKTADVSNIRRYRLGHDHELACNGRFVVIGKSTGKTGLYARTVKLWLDTDVEAMGSRQDFRERIHDLPVNSRLIFYANMEQPVSLKENKPSPRAGGWWPVLGSDWATAAVGITVTPESLIIGSSRRLEEYDAQYFSRTLSVDNLRRIPASAVLAWVQNIDYVKQYARLKENSPPEPLGFLVEVLTTDISDYRLERDFLEHLSDESVFVIGQSTIPVPEAEVPGVSVVVPVIALTLKTDESQVVEQIMEKMADNLLQLCELAAGENQSVEMQMEIVDEQGTRINSIPLQTLFDPQAENPLLSHLQFSWSFDGQTLIIASHTDLARQIIQARHERTPQMKLGNLQDRIERLRNRDGHLHTALIAEPGTLRYMVHSWLVYIRRYHPEMLQSDWWRWFHQQRSFSTEELGVILREPEEEENGLIISRIQLDSPAEAYLQPGDRILGVEDKRLEEHDSRETLDEMIRNRRKRERLALQILRNGRQRKVIIPLPTENLDAPQLEPIELLRQFSSLLGVFSSAHYTSWRQSPSIAVNRLELNASGNP